MCTDLINLTMRSVEVIEIVKGLSNYNLDYTFENDYVNNVVVRRKLKFYYRTEEILTLILNFKYEGNNITLSKIKTWLKNKESLTINLKELIPILRNYFKEHSLSNYNLSNNCFIITDKEFVMYRDNRIIENIKINYDSNTNSKYFSVKYRGDKTIRYSGYNSDFIKMYNKKFRGNNPKILTW